MSKESYVRGFCKAAQAAGVDPNGLMKFVKSTNRTAGINNSDLMRWMTPGKNVGPYNRRGYIENLQKIRITPTDFSAFSDIVSRLARNVNVNGSPRISDGLRVRDAVLNPDESTRLSTSLMRPEAKKVYDALTNAVDVATKPLIGMDGQLPIQRCNLQQMMQNGLIRANENLSENTQPTQINK